MPLQKAYACSAVENTQWKVAVIRTMVVLSACYCLIKNYDTNYKILY